MITYTIESFNDLLTTEELDEPDTCRRFNRWLARGDGIAVYENHDMGHPELGHKLFISFGSERAQLEVAEPPTRLPDIGSNINWRYQLIGTYKGEQL